MFGIVNIYYLNYFNKDEVDIATSTMNKDSSHLQLIVSCFIHAHVDDTAPS